jgi:hypothetical protein
MGNYTDIDEIIRAQRRIVRRSGWVKAAVSALVSAALSVAGTAWKTTRDVAELKRILADQGKDLEYVKSHLPSVEQTAIAARGDAQRVERLLFAHLGSSMPAGQVR